MLDGLWRDSAKSEPSCPVDTALESLAYQNILLMQPYGNNNGSFYSNGRCGLERTMKKTLRISIVSVEYQGLLLE